MVRTLQVTIGASLTQVLPAGEIVAKWVLFQNNATHTMRLGDSNTSSSRGIQLVAGASANPPGSAPVSITKLSGWYVSGTQNDVLDVIYDDGQ